MEGTRELQISVEYYIKSVVFFIASVLLSSSKLVVKYGANSNGEMEGWRESFPLSPVKRSFLVSMVILFAIF